MNRSITITLSKDFFDAENIDLNGITNLPAEIPVTLNFDKSLVIGKAYVHKDAEYVLCELELREFTDFKLPYELIQSLAVDIEKKGIEFNLRELAVTANSFKKTN